MAIVIEVIPDGPRANLVVNDEELTKGIAARARVRAAKLRPVKYTALRDEIERLRRLGFEIHVSAAMSRRCAAEGVTVVEGASLPYPEGWAT